MKQFHMTCKTMLQSILKVHTKFTRKHIISTSLSSSSYNNNYYYCNYHTSNDEPQNIQKLYHQDWLSPNEILKIFNTLQPSSVLTAFTHVSSRKDYKPTQQLYNVVINKLAQDNNFHSIDDLLKLMKTQKYLRLSDSFFNDLIRVYGNVGGFIDRVVEILFKMPEYHQCYPSVKTFNLVLNLLVSSQRFDLLPVVFCGIRKLGVEIDACSLNIMIKGMCKRGCLDHARQLFDEFPLQGLKRSKITYSTIMHCMCKKGMLNDAFEMLGVMEKEGISPDSVTFNVLAAGLQKGGRVDEAMKLLDRMSLIGCNPNKGTYQEVLYGLLKAKRYGDALAFVQRMRCKGLIPSFLSYKQLIQGLCEEEMMVVEDVEWVLSSMLLVGFVPKISMWNTILHKMFHKEDDKTS